ncbi:interleukin-8-like [Elgaria multicarinata webbii]|uniref:interleukin-8-like n=1 Tax=Elgaria multicarinata webbii TaxID=159646 RepID=UPI002FCD5E9B
MKGLIVILTLALVASKICPLCSLAMESLVVNMGRCKCLMEISSPVKTKNIKSIQVIPQGIRCRRTEVILSLKHSSRKICAPPNAKWVEDLIMKLTKRTIQANYGLPEHPEN